MVMSDPFTIYLAGGYRDEWRDYLVDTLKGNVRFINPFRDSRQGALAEFTLDDLAHIDNSHLMIAFSDYPQQDGLMLEFGYAYARKVPIVYCVQQPRVASMAAGVSRAVFTDLEELALWVQRRILDVDPRAR